MLNCHTLNLNAGIKKRWNDDRKCGTPYSLIDGFVPECDPDGDAPCCGGKTFKGWCINYAYACNCSSCTNYTRIYREWEETKGKQKWRYDGRCGQRYSLPDGTTAQCDPNGEKPCCFLADRYGRCSNAMAACRCRICTNYTRIYREWEETNGKQKWRYDGKCGKRYLLPDGVPAECNPNGDYPCCNNDLYGRCGSTIHSCTCSSCTNYTRIYREWEETKGKQKWRYDGRCGKHYPLPDGALAQCDPDEGTPCCSQYGNCGNNESQCLCADCVDYRVVREIKKSGKSCAVAKVHSGFIKHVCFIRNQIYFKCINWDGGSYKPNYSDGDNFAGLHELIGVFEACENGPYFYQACRFNTDITNTAVICGDFINCKHYEGRKHEYIDRCEGDCKSENRLCITKGDKSNDSSNHLASDFLNASALTKLPKSLSINCGAPVFFICDGREYCHDGSDEQNCNVTDSTVYTCPHYREKVVYNKILTVPIFNYTRCSAFDVSNSYHPYCLNYLDQTNCSDIELVGGYCEVNGHMSTVSKYMNCYEYDKRSKQHVTLCDDGIQNECISLFTSDCQVHKHLMCDGVKDCADGSDEINQICNLKTEEIDFACTRRFQPRIGNTIMPISWIMDNVTDCMDSEDENPTLWANCPGHAISPAEFPCQDVFFCPGVEKTAVLLKNLCNGIESCGNGNEIEVCRTARDFPVIKTTAQTSSDLKRHDVCNSAVCDRMEFIRPWGNVLGEVKIELLVPNHKVNCSQQFGEYYLYLSCMGLCMEANVSCPLSGENRKLEHNSCTGQYPDRAYTLANNSFLTFVKKSDTGHYHQDFYRCNNNKCIEYSHVCNLVDDCGDMSDEIGCTNHMICADTKTLTKHQFVSWSQKCDGIYDCFDLSDECNESCARQILGHWILKCVCWLMGILAAGFNFCSIFHGFNSIKDCQTAGMMATKVLLIFIALGDLLMGVYLIILAVYDSFIFKGLEYCQRQTEWLTGTACLVLGVISTVGSQVSLFSMTAFSFIRMYGLLYRSMRIPGPVNKKSLTKIFFMASAILTSSLVVALIPLVPSLEDYFVQGMYYNPSYKIFVGFPTKSRHIDVLEAYYKHSNSSFHGITEDMSWKDIEKKVNGMFSQEYGSLARKPVHFYGNDGVCLFKYFVRTDDARRNRQSSGSGVEMNDPVVWTMLVVNFVCFLIMTYCYIRIIRNTKESTQSSGQYDNPQRLAENRAMHNRIMAIIVTDFLCWIPFIFISGLHNLSVINASSWYTSFAMTVLPLNSVINPLIYDKAIGDFILRHLSRLTAIIIPRISTAVGGIAGLFRTRNNNNEPSEIIPLEVMNPPNDTVN